MSEFKTHRWFPQNFEKHRGIPINSHPGAFGCARKHNFHEGVDLYGTEGDWVYAIRDGVVVSNEQFTGLGLCMAWWNDTDAVLVQDEDGYYVYGEIKSPLKVGQTVGAGDKIGHMIPVLPPEKHRPDIPQHSVTMLHLERYNNKYDVSIGWSSWNHREDRPEYLEDPTPELIKILTSKRIRVDLLTL